MSAGVISRWTRRFLLVAGLFLVASQGAALLGFGERVEYALGLLGFVLTVVFGKAYSLVPSYFNRSLAWPHAPAVHLPLLVVGVIGLATAEAVGATIVGRAGALAWVGGVAVFVLTLALTVRDNPTGGETGTGRANRFRHRLDRLANPFMPIALGYLLAGSYLLLAGEFPLLSPFGADTWRTFHLLGVGFALLMLFSVGFRLLPRFLVVDVPTAPAMAVLAAGAVGPALLAIGFPAGRLFQAGAVLVGTAVALFAATLLWMVSVSDRTRVGLYGPSAGVVLGVLGVAIGVWFAVSGTDPALRPAHVRLNVFGLLGLSIVGVVYQFYPPAVGTWPGSTDRSALASIAALAAGVLLASGGPLLAPWIIALGQLLVVAAGVTFTYLVASAIRTQARRG